MTTLVEKRPFPQAPFGLAAIERAWLHYGVPVATGFPQGRRSRAEVVQIHLGNQPKKRSGSIWA